MAVKIMVPQLGESVVEGVLGKWHYEEGDRVERDETLLEIETDKINMDIPCIATGTLGKIFVPEGTTVEVEQLLGIILEEGEEFDESMIADGAPADEEAKVAEIATAPAPAPAPAAQAATPAPASAEGDTARGRLSPAVRRLIDEHNLNIEEIPGTGKDGRIRKIDIERYLEDPSYRHAAPAPPIAAPLPAGVAASTTDFPEERIALTPIRKTIAQAMQRSVNTAAHTLNVQELDCTNLVKFRIKMKERVADEYGAKLTYLPFFIKAAVHALKKHPYANASITESEIILKKYYNIGFAVNTDAGLVVPNIKHADRKSLIEIAREITELAEKARARKLTMEDITGGTFTLTNAGGFGAILSSPIINFPEAAILAVHAIEKRPVVRDGEIVIRDMMYLALQFDHRIIDGVYAIEFQTTIQKLIEEPELLFMNI